LLLRGVESLMNDSEVEVIYGNTPDRPMTDSKGRILAGASFTISDTLPRHRNVLKGKIVAGVLTTEPADILLTQTWGQGGARDIRGNRTKWDYRRGRLRLVPAGWYAGRAARRLPTGVRRDPKPGAGRRGIGTFGGD
jgi:hypothetical protein